jgi:hypothetical protein
MYMFSSWNGDGVLRGKKHRVLSICIWQDEMWQLLCFFYWEAFAVTFPREKISNDQDKRLFFLSLFPTGASLSIQTLYNWRIKMDFSKLNEMNILVWSQRFKTELCERPNHFCVQILSKEVLRQRFHTHEFWLHHFSQLTSFNLIKHVINMFYQFLHHRPHGNVE